MGICLFFENVLRRSAGSNNKEFFLRSNLLFQGLSAGDCRVLAMGLHERRYAAGEIVFKEGETGAAMYLIQSGSVRVFRGSESLIRLEAGDFFGDMALFSDEKRSASVEANEDSILLVFSKGDLDALVNRSPRIANKMLLRFAEVLVKRLHQTNVAAISVKPVRPVAK